MTKFLVAPASLAMKAFLGVVLFSSINACQQQPPQIIVNANSSADKTNSFTATETTTSNSRSAQVENPSPTVIAVAPGASSADSSLSYNTNKSREKSLASCRVNDPNDTYVNLRQTPNGSLIGPVANGTSIQITGYQSDSQGRDWAEVYTSNKQVGYMFRRMLSCG